MSGCYCGEFNTPTVAPDEFGETMWHDPDKCEVKPTRIPDAAIIKVLRKRAEDAKAEGEALRAQVQAVRDAIGRHQRIYAGSRDDGVPVQVLLRALDGGESDE